MTRHVIKITGASGSGLLSTGEILMKALKRQGFYMNADREYPSLIKGGHANFQVNFSTEKVHALSQKVDLFLAVDRVGLKEYIHTAPKGSIFVHGDERYKLIVPNVEKKAEELSVRLVYLPARQIAYSFGGNELMTNMVLLGLAWRVLGLPLNKLQEEVEKRFASKPKILEIDLKCLKAGYDANGIPDLPKLDISHPKKTPKTMLINGTEALCLGAIHAGVRAYYAYPMSPSSGILTYIAKKAKETGMLVKQGEDEITVAEMTLGSMFMGTRALSATSGGGYDLMTETVSLSGITETPFVIVNCQRPGPGTGLPTWTCQGDLDLALYSSHGEFPRAVLACSDPESSYELIQHALNIAEKYQIIVVVLTEKTILESRMTTEFFELKKIPIERGIVTDPNALKNLVSKNRYEFTESGVSLRWLPGSGPAHYYANGDEHHEDGTLAEDAEPAKKMMEKRMRKLKTVEETLPEPEIYGSPKGADVSFVGWGSTKNVMLDAIQEAKLLKLSINYLHYDYVWPLKTKVAQKFFEENKNVCLVEGNYLGQFGTLFEAKSGLKFQEKFLKYDGRAFYLEEVLEFSKKIQNLKFKI
ncbi:2-oxoacid:acceptor oxidoreductase subunit alpha [Candidatus Peregrinibacteria bacterium]|nr:2-oxoacid:acceptor oxidoreductase subunit alpha [Candidatus Peregrinibacteria bacterium]